MFRNKKNINNTNNDTISKSGKSRFSVFKSLFTTRNTICFIAIATLLVIFLGKYTVNKVDANLREQWMVSTEKEESFKDKGNVAFADGESAISKSTTNLMKTAQVAASDTSAEFGRSSRAEVFLEELDKLADGIIANGFTYSNSNNSKTYEGALKKKKVTNCARYVSWAAQRAGLIPSGSTFWLDTKINGDKSDILNSPYLEVSYPNAKANTLDLEPGDIVGWSRHTAVYAGKNSSGQMLWISAGGDGTSGNRFTDKMRARPRPRYDTHKISVLIKIK